MECPDEIRKALSERESVAWELIRLDVLITDWLMENQIGADDKDYNLGYAVVTEPSLSKERILAAIEAKPAQEHT